MFPSITGSSGLCCFKGPTWTNHSYLIFNTLTGFRLPIFTLLVHHLLSLSFPEAQNFLPKVSCTDTCACLQLRAGMYCSVPVAFAAAKEISLDTEENYWCGYSAASEHSQPTYVQWDMSFCPRVIGWKLGATKDVLQR